MNVSVILAHPNKNSFNHAIAYKAIEILKSNGYKIFYHDLYDERFDPLLFQEEFPKEAKIPPHIEIHCKQITLADGIIIIHPNWWGQPPAIMKGWVDRVLRPGVAYEFNEGDLGEGIPIGLLKAKVALVFNTSNTPQDREIEVFGDPLERLWKDCIFNLCGVKIFYRKMFRVIVTSSEKQRAKWLKETEDIINEYFPQNRNI
jgi:putative NADPH-quinone reductase